MQSAQPTIRFERDEKHPLAVIVGQGVLAHNLNEQLKASGLRTLLLEHSSEKWHALETPHYCYLLVSPKDRLALVAKIWQEVLPLARRSKTKVVFLCLGLSSEIEQRLLRLASGERVEVLTLVLAGEIENVLVAPKAFLQDCINASFGQWTKKRQTIVVRGGPGHHYGGNRQQAESWEAFLRLRGLHNTQSVMASLEKSQKSVRASQQKPNRFNWGRRRLVLGWRAVLLMTVFFLVLPFLVALLAYGGGVSHLLQARIALGRGEFLQASYQAGEAERVFLRGKFVTTEVSALSLWGQTILAPVVEIGESGSRIAGVVKRGAILQKNVTDLARDIFSGNNREELPQQVATLHPELLALNHELGLAQGLLKANEIQTLGSIFSWLGFPVQLVTRAPDDIARARGLLISADRILTVLPELLAISSPGNLKTTKQSRTYLLVFQNSAELRPTGGFIGSFAILTIEEGVVKDLVFHDVYSADGQLQGRVVPPAEIVHFLGQNSWFLRDANFSPDFPLTAKRLEFFLEKETGQRVDGVIAIDLQAVQYLLRATGPLPLVDFADQVTAENFFQKAEFASEINFFPGSTKKRDYLGAVGQSLLQTLLHDPKVNNLAVAQALERGLREQHIMLFFNNRTAQERVEANSWSGSITRHSCGTAISNCLMLVEANFGANKANYFVKRAMRVSTTIGEGGDTETKVVVHLKNESPSLAWPAGDYKNYLRFLLPAKARLTGVTMSGDKTATISSTLSADVLAKVPPDKFLVHTSVEASGALALSTTNSYLSVGMLVLVPIKSSREITLTYRWTLPITKRQASVAYRQVILKQGGTSADPLDISVEFPQNWKKIAGAGKVRDTTGIVAGALVFPQRVLYNTDLGSDQILEIEFLRK